MEKQRIKNIFQNLNIKTEEISHHNKTNNLQQSDRLATEIGTPSKKIFGPKRKACRKLIFDPDPGCSLEKLNSVRSQPAVKIISNVLLPKHFFHTEKIASSLKENDLHSITINTEKISPVLEKDPLHISPATTTQDAPLLLESQEEKVLLPKHFDKENVASSLQENSSHSINSINEKISLVLEEDPLHLSPAITTQDAQTLLLESQDNNPASNATKASVNNIVQAKFKASFVCKIDLSRLVTIKNKLITSEPQQHSKSPSLNMDDVKENKNTPSGGYPNDVASTSYDVMTEPTQKSNRKVLRAKKKPYQISPINSNESDPDLSDADPTYNAEMDKMNKRPSLLSRFSSRRSRSLSSSSSSSSSSSGTSSESRVDRSSTPERKTRKRKRNPESWKFNTAKRLRNAGQSYVSTRSNKVVSARSVKPPCNEKCRLKCSEKIAEDDRKTYFDKFWSMKSVDIQRAYIKSCMVEIKPKYKYSTTEHPRKSNNAFYLKEGNREERVCKTFFINTLDISDRMIRTVKEKTDEHNFLSEDKRGKHDHHRKIDALLVTDIKNFIRSIPRVESHYTRATSSCEYIAPGKTLTDIYNDFVEDQQNNGRPSGKFCNFYEIFKDTGLKFHQPIKDLCDLCRDYRLKRSEDLKEEFDIHIEEKELSRKEKKTDRYAIDENNVCAVYDLEAILQAPHGTSSSFYYKTKVNCYNFTIAELAKKTPSEEESNKAYTNVYSYFWDETQGQKGAIEITTCVFNFLKIINDRPTSKSVKVTFYSDNCCGQNKNKFIATLYMYALTQFDNIHCITHKYLIKGHTQNENDNAHSLIEKEIRKYIKADTIYIPLQYIPLIKSAKKTGKKFQVQTLTFDDFIDIKNLQTQWGSNFTKDRERNPLTWNNVKILEFRKEEQFKFYVKTSYKDELFREIDVRAGLRKALPQVQDVVLGKAYNKRFELKENQKRDLKSLIDKKAIPPYYSSFYNDVI